MPPPAIQIAALRNNSRHYIKFS